MVTVTAERTKRATAGRRMNVLIGEAAENDELFWTHSTWDEKEGADGGDSEEGSYNLDDENESDVVDTFDSDFNESEGEMNEDEEAQEEKRIEREIELDERKSRRAAKRKEMTFGGAITKSRSSARANKIAKKGSTRGNNAGLVLKMPVDSAHGAAMVAGRPAVNKADAAASVSRRPRTARKPLARTLRGTTVSKAIVAEHARIETERKQAVIRTKVHARKSQQKRKYTQEELLLEAANVTEQENMIWLLGRKRQLSESERIAAALQRDKNNADHRGKVIMRFHSRRGCYNTLTFPEMDLIPDYIQRHMTIAKKKQEKQQKNNKKVQDSNVVHKPSARTVVCFITGEKAKYRDPKTGHPYSNAAAFREIRKRFLEGTLNPLPGFVKLRPTSEPEEMDTKTKAAQNAETKNKIVRNTTAKEKKTKGLLPNNASSSPSKTLNRGNTHPAIAKLVNKGNIVQVFIICNAQLFCQPVPKNKIASQSKTQGNDKAAPMKVPSVGMTSTLS